MALFGGIKLFLSVITWVVFGIAYLEIAQDFLQPLEQGSFQGIIDRKIDNLARNYKLIIIMLSFIVTAMNLFLKFEEYRLRKHERDSKKNNQSIGSDNTDKDS